MALVDLDFLAEPLGHALSKVVGALDPRVPRTVAVLDLGLPVDDEVAQLVRSFRGVVLHSEGDVLVAVFATPMEGVRCVLELSDRSRERDRWARGAMHDGLMSDRTSDFVEHVSRAAAELGDLTTSGQLLITGAVLDGLMSDDRIDATFLESIALDGQVTAVYEVRRLEP
jgi:class 3 adenylate cyclase